MKIRMMLTHILTVCHTTAFPVLRKESKKRKRVTLRQKGNRHGWRIRGQSLGRNDMSHSQKAGFDTLAKSQSGLFPPCRRPWETYAKTA